MLKEMVIATSNVTKSVPHVAMHITTKSAQVIVNMSSTFTMEIPPTVTSNVCNSAPLVMNQSNRKKTDKCTATNVQSVITKEQVGTWIARHVQLDTIKPQKDNCNASHARRVPIKISLEKIAAKIVTLGLSIQALVLLLAESVLKVNLLLIK